MNSFQQIFESNELTIATINREKGKAVAGSTLYLFIKEFLLKHLNVGKTMDDAQLAYLCDLIIEEYYFLQIDDFKFCFAKALKGDYGTVYDRIDANIILDWLKRYSNSRCAIGALITVDESKTKAIECDKVSSYDEYLKSIAERAKNGDKSAIEALEHARSLAEFREKTQPAYNEYAKDREKKRLYGK